jgi:hypothetical protein
MKAIYFRFLKVQWALTGTILVMLLGCQQDVDHGIIMIPIPDQIDASTPEMLSDMTTIPSVEESDGGQSEPRPNENDRSVLLNPPSKTGLPDVRGISPGDPTVLQLGEIQPINYERFVTSAACSMCHSNHESATAMRDTQNRELGPFNLWQGTMMANSARDPLWIAAVSAEVAQTPTRGVEIEAKCMRCHAPMASVTARAADRQPAMADLFDEGSGASIVGLDGVACAVCHQIQKRGLGTDRTFGGEFEIGTDRIIYGPHENPATGPMQAHVDYTPTYSNHVTNSALCASCHTLFTHPYSPEGVEDRSVSFPEQTTYLEWLNSSFGEEDTSCQDCHMPTSSEDDVPIETRIARAPPGFDFNIRTRSPFGRHIFSGANTLIPEMIKRERAILNPQATDAAFDMTVANARRYLQEDTSALSWSNVTVDEGVLSFSVTVKNRAGHKFPTGIPIRRAWLRVTVDTPDGTRLFRSGGFNRVGRLVDQSGDVLDIEKAGAGWEPHHEVISRHDEVQIYETIMGDGDGAYTYLLMRAASYLKDNRLLPRGFNEDYSRYNDIRPHGVESDEDFVGGSDTVAYRVPVGNARAFNVEVTLFYQTASARFITELFQNDTGEVRAFRTMYERADLTPTRVVTTSFEHHHP